MKNMRCKPDILFEKYTPQARLIKQNALKAEFSTMS